MGPFSKREKLTVDPNAESQEIKESFTLNRIPTEVRISFRDQLRVRGQSASRQIDGDLGSISQLYFGYINSIKLDRFTSL